MFIVCSFGEKTTSHKDIHAPSRVRLRFKFND